MLKVTPIAAAALTAARAESGAPDTHGVRFFTRNLPDAQARVAFEFVEAPQPNDAITEESGLKTYVAPEVSQAIGDATVDVEQIGGQAQLVLRGGLPGDAAG